MEFRVTQEHRANLAAKLGELLGDLVTKLVTKHGDIVAKCGGVFALTPHRGKEAAEQRKHVGCCRTKDRIASQRTSTTQLDCEP